MNMNKFKEIFLGEVARHEMKIINDTDVNRHLRFKAPGTNNCYFDLITWDNHLCITGDVGTYVFSRVNDMFGFFRQKNLKINPQYWSEKCLAESTSCNGVKQFSKELFEAAVMSEFSEHVKCMIQDIDLLCRDSVKSFGKEMRELWADIKAEILCPENEHDAVSSVCSFDGPDDLFEDFWAAEIMDYTGTFLWCLHAIVWGISVYDTGPSEG